MWTHWLVVAPILVKFAKREFDNVIALGTVLFTSENYWRKPERGPRRNLDIVCVHVVGVYNVYRNPVYWIPIKVSCFIIWRLANVYSDKRIHSLVHVLPVIAYLCEGLVPKALGLVPKALGLTPRIDDDEYRYAR